MFLGRANTFVLQGEKCPKIGEIKLFGRVGPTLLCLKSSTNASRRSPFIRPKVQPTAVIKSICEPKMIVAKKLVARLRRDYNPRKRGKIKENGVADSTGGRLPPYGNDRKIGAEMTEFCAKRHLKQHKHSNAFYNKACVPASPVYIMRHKQSPVNGKNIPFTGSDL